MIKSIIISQTPLIIKHILSPSISEIESQKGVNEAIELIDTNISKTAKFGMLINVSNYSFETLEARRIWSLQFKMNRNIQKRTDFVAIVGSSNEAFGTEKIWMKTKRLKFFEKEQEVEMWLLETKTNATNKKYR